MPQIVIEDVCRVRQSYQCTSVYTPRCFHWSEIEGSEELIYEHLSFRVVMVNKNLDMVCDFYSTSVGIVVVYLVIQVSALTQIHVAKR
jgi:hypothetical protein